MIVTHLLALVVAIVSASASSSAWPSATAFVTDPTAVAAANRLLEEELKLAARSQIYLVVDLSRSLVLVKGRGLELQRIPVQAWHQSGQASLAGVFTLRARPPVPRPKATAVDNVPLAAIELSNMPTTYQLRFDRGLLITVAGPWREAPWEWSKSVVQDWYHRFLTLAGLGREEPVALHLRLTLAQESAQLLAWSVLEGMPLLVGPTTVASQ